MNVEWNPGWQNHRQSRQIYLCPVVPQLQFCPSWSALLVEDWTLEATTIFVLRTYSAAVVGPRRGSWRLAADGRKCKLTETCGDGYSCRVEKAWCFGSAGQKSFSTKFSKYKTTTKDQLMRHVFTYQLICICFSFHSIKSCPSHPVHPVHIIRFFRVDKHTSNAGWSTQNQIHSKLNHPDQNMCLGNVQVFGS